MANLKKLTLTDGIPGNAADDGDVLTLNGAVAWSAGTGVGLTWTTCMSTELNALASGNAILASADIDNSAALDRYADFSINLPSAVFAGAGANIALHLYPLNADGATYGDSKFVSAAPGPPNGYCVGTFPLVVGTQAQTGTIYRVEQPPGKYRLVFVNNGGVALAATLNLLKYRTYN